MIEDEEIKTQVSPFAIREGEIKTFDGKDGYVSMNQIINRITYSIYEAETYDKKTNTCTPKKENEQLIPIVTKDSLELTCVIFL